MRPFATPFIVTPSRGLHADADVRINDFPVHMFLAVLVGLPESPSTFAAIHPYAMRVGLNRCSVESASREPGPYTIVELDAQREKQRRIFTTFALGRSSDFSWSGRVPAWRWTRGQRISSDVATRDSLYAAYARLHAAIEAARVADDEVYEEVSQDIHEFAVASAVAHGIPFTRWQKFYEAARRRDAIEPRGASVEALVARNATTLHVFANGTLAYLAMRPREDAPEFPVAIALINNDMEGGYMNILPWFRVGDDGQWHVDGMTKDSRTF